MVMVLYVFMFVFFFLFDLFLFEVVMDWKGVFVFSVVELDGLLIGIVS